MKRPSFADKTKKYNAIPSVQNIINIKPFQKKENLDGLILIFKFVYIFKLTFYS